jgi:hypothetical protein
MYLDDTRTFSFTSEAVVRCVPMSRKDEMTERIFSCVPPIQPKTPVRSTLPLQRDENVYRCPQQENVHEKAQHAAYAEHLCGPCIPARLLGSGKGIDDEGTVDCLYYSRGIVISGTHGRTLVDGTCVDGKVHAVDGQDREPYGSSVILCLS